MNVLESGTSPNELDGRASTLHRSTTSRTSKVLALSLGQALATVGSIVSVMVATRFLSNEDYGTYRQTFLAYDFALPLLSLGLPTALYYFLPRSQGRARGVILDNLLLLFVGGSTFSLFLIAGGSSLLATRFSNPSLHDSLKWLTLYPILTMPAAIVAAVMVSTSRIRLLTFYNVATSLLVTTAVIIGILMTRSYVGAVIARVAVAALVLPLALWLVFTSVSGPFDKPSTTSMKEILSYSIPLGLASMLGTLTLQLHSVIVSSLSTPEQFAVYINGATELPLIGIITGSITAVVIAEMSTLLQAGDTAGALRLFRIASIKSAAILLPTMCFFIIAADPFILVMYTSRYKDSVLPFLIYLTVLPVRIVVYGAALMAMGMTRAVLFRSVFDLLINAVLCFVFVSAFGYIGAAISLMATLYFWTVPYNLFKLAQGFKISWAECVPFRDLGIILLISVLCMPLAAVGVYSVSTSPLARLVTGLTLFWPAAIYLLNRYGYLTMPHALVDWLRNRRNVYRGS